MGFLERENSISLLTMKTHESLATQVLEEFKLRHPKVGQMQVVKIPDSLSFIGGVALDISHMNCELLVDEEKAIVWLDVVAITIVICQ
ncbi:uncharacterized protein G2W53_041907 [Senna tora]|uniref:Uncharacterized protein n=1 Tax=Senna tora TaxID=362788 RepID=A0A834SGG7_9FABA|nr:uncharacterized protein G2W53_041907 [Senna tora]